ncbi:MAG: right-handed parallel beta-helix repeat-containing protein [Candidatus Brocadiae bacterium]|nr:right-handed parallel beta-helix repeat-containing protein [Candidatus Brocadiia bacterium]
MPTACAIIVAVGASAGIGLQGIPAQEGLAKMPATGTVHYVDFEGGRDDNDGLTRDSAFKHCPGDTEAAGRAGIVELSPGDKVIFKGGVHYRSTVTVARSGTEGRPIVYDGNTDGTFGDGKAIIQGGEPVTGWKKVASAKDVEGNPNWGKLYYTYLDGHHTFFNFSLYEGDTYLNAAQDPKPEDPFFHDRVGSYRNTRTADGSSLTDPDHFTSPDPEYYGGAYLALHIQPNMICYQAITGYVPAEHKVSFRPHGRRVYGGRRGHRYALLNSLKVLDRPGEYCLDEKDARDGKVRLVLWPHKAGADGPENVSISTRAHGFLIPDGNHIVIDGFKISQHGGEPRAAAVMKYSGPRNRGIVIRNNEICRGWPTPNVNITRLRGIQGAITLRNVSHSLVENNSIYENRRMGILGAAFDDSIFRYNFLRRNGSTAASFHTCQRSKLQYNIVWDNLGIHANGLTVYLGSSDMLVEGNEVYNSNDCLTLSSSSNITVRRNILDAHGLEVCIAAWSGRPMKNVTIVNNVLLHAGGSWKSGIYENAGIEGCIIKNNIIDGIACSRGSVQGEMSHNLWTSRGRSFQEGKPGDIFESDLRKIFMDPDNHDYRLKPGSPAIDAGTETEGREDIAGTAVPQGDKPDIGAYEFVPNGPRYRKGHAGSLAPPIRPSPPAKLPSH